MVESGGVNPPSGPSQKPSEIPKQIHTKMSDSYTVKGNTALRKWVKHFYPSMSEPQVDKFVERFTMTICQQINKQIAKELKQARKTARRLREAEEGTD